MYGECTHGASLPRVEDFSRQSQRSLGAFAHSGLDSHKHLIVISPPTELRIIVFTPKSSSLVTSSFNIVGYNKLLLALGDPYWVNIYTMKAVGRISHRVDKDL